MLERNQYPRQRAHARGCIRREFDIAEGDAFNRAPIDRAETAPSRRSAICKDREDRDRAGLGAR